jgi:hypothetical protein
MVAPVQGTDIDLNKLEVVWLAQEGIKTGGSEILTYNLQYD